MRSSSSGRGWIQGACCGCGEAVAGVLVRWQRGGKGVVEVWEEGKSRRTFLGSTFAVGLLLIGQATRPLA